MSEAPKGYDPDQAPLADAGLFGLPFSPEEAALVVCPVPWDVTTSYRPGTAQGPEAIRRASHQLDLFDTETGEPWKKGIALLPISSETLEKNATLRSQAQEIIDLGGRIEGNAKLEISLEQINDACAGLNGSVFETVNHWRKKGKVVGLLGGDHSIPFGAIQSLAQEFDSFGILHVDAHADLRPAYEGFTWSHASIMHNVMTRIPQVTKLVQVGLRDLSRGEHDTLEASPERILPHFDPKLMARKHAGEPWKDIVQEILEPLPNQVYISLDIDGLDPANCPNTGTPVPGGLTFGETCTLLSELGNSGRQIVGFDLSEVAPGPKGDEWDANVGARLLYKLCGWALKTHG